MSRIGTYTAYTNLVETDCDPKITPSAQDWEFSETHDKNRGMVIVSVRPLYSSFLKVLPNSISHPGSKTSHPDHHSRITNILLPESNLIGLYLHRVFQGLDIVASHIHVFLIFLWFPTYRHKYCGPININIF